MAQPKAWLMVASTFSPYDADLWEWSITAGEETGDGSRIFFASPLWDESGLPVILSLTHLAMTLTTWPDRCNWRCAIRDYVVTCLE